MSSKRSALAVVLGLVALGIVASQSLFVEGEATGTTVPGLHPTTETAIAALIADETQAAAVAEVKCRETPQAQPVRSTASAAAPKAAARPDGVPAGYVYWKTVHAKVTAYEPTERSCGKHANGRTSIGENAWVMDGVAADPRAIPYGTYLVIPGIGTKEVDDTGSAMRHFWRQHGRYQVDVRMPYYGQAKRFGVKNLDVKLYRKVS